MIATVDRTLFGGTTAATAIRYRGERWVISVNVDDSVHIKVGRCSWDTGRYDGEVIHDTKRTPTQILDCVEAEWGGN